MRRRELARIGTTAGRTIRAILIILVGLAWEFSAEIHTFVGQFIGQKLQAWLAEYISQIGPLALIGGGIFWIAFLHTLPTLRRWLRPSPLAVIYKPQTHTSVRRRNLRDYHIELRNCTTDQTISDVIVTWDETPFTRFIDQELSRDWLMSPTSIAPSSSASIFLFSLEDDLRTAANRNDVLASASTITVRASGKGTDELIARFRYEPDRLPKLRRLWR
jgi:hypothetical protein